MENQIKVNRAITVSVGLLFVAVGLWFAVSTVTITKKA